ncbi:MAG: hypothetical protein JXM73_10360 [Anaerolineae bacterium]|nr:hypothetical protein [Anaerolineae bacterium]
MDILFILLVGGCGLAVALAIGAIVLLKLGVLAKYALQPERPEDKLGDYGLEGSRKVSMGTEQAQGEQNGSD